MSAIRSPWDSATTFDDPAGPLDGMLHARTGFPISMLGAEQFMGISFENVFRPSLTPGQRELDRAIRRRRAAGASMALLFKRAAATVQGDLGRNALSGFGMSQLDLALRREFFAGERRSIQLRVEAFNALNHPNFGDPVRSLSSPLFGQSSSMLNLMLGTGSPGSGLAPIFQSGGANRDRSTFQILVAAKLPPLIAR